MMTAWLSFIVVVVVSSLRGVAADSPRDGLNYIQAHAWLMWFSFGFLFPLGAILMRFSRPANDPTVSKVSPSGVRMLFYLHAVFQCVGVLAATAGVAVLFKSMGFLPQGDTHTHQKLGLALWVIVVIMPLIGILSPTRGTKLRLYWFVVHWLFGTGVIILGIVNLFIGINLYQSPDYIDISINSLNFAFSVQVALMGLVYFFQDSWSYILGQEVK